MAIKRRSRKPLTLDELRCSMSTALRELETIFMDDTAEHETRIRAINALATLSNSYSKVTEISDLEARIQALEAAKLKKVS